MHFLNFSHFLNLPDQMSQQNLHPLIHLSNILPTAARAIRPLLPRTSLSPTGRASICSGKRIQFWSECPESNRNPAGSHNFGRASSESAVRLSNAGHYTESASSTSDHNANESFCVVWWYSWEYGTIGTAMQGGRDSQFGGVFGLYGDSAKWCDTNSGTVWIGTMRFWEGFGL